MKVTEIVTRLKTMETEQRAGIKSSFAHARERAQKNAQALELARQIIDHAATEAVLPVALVRVDNPSRLQTILDGRFNQPCTRDHICLTAAGGPCNGIPQDRFQ
jgi:DNA-binding TFAR19-related protein (PDSD5 family)